MRLGLGLFIGAAFGGAAPAPTTSSIAPVVGDYSGGTPVTITGTNFTGATGATIGGTAITSFSVVNPTTITGVTASHAASATAVDVVVQHPSGNATASAAFKYWNPSVLAKCVMWLRADLGVTEAAGLVTAWASQVDGGNANKTVSASGAQRPTQATDAGYNGKQIIKTTGASQRLVPPAAWAVSSAVPNEMATVGHCPSGAAQTIVDGHDINTTRNFIRSTATGDFWGMGVTSVLNGVTHASTTPTIVSALFNGASSKLYVKNSQTANATGNPGSQVQGSADIFCNGGSDGGGPNSNAASGAGIAEGAWFNDVLTDPERLELFTYFGGRYALTYS